MGDWAVMDAKTAEALEKSIEHWKANVDAATPGDAKVGGDHCALCEMFQDRPDEKDCVGCPVMMRTGENGCRRTPYYEARHELIRWARVAGGKDQFQDAARAELAFLESLRETK
jgi:hypothetical protein